MKNFVAEGKNLTVAAPENKNSGDAWMHGGLLVVGMTDVLNGKDVAVKTEGVYTLPKESTTHTTSEGDVAYWDDTAKKFDAKGAGLFRVGIFVQDTINTATTVKVRLDGIASIAEV